MSSLSPSLSISTVPISLSISFYIYLSTSISPSIPPIPKGMQLRWSYLCLLMTWIFQDGEACIAVINKMSQHPNIDLVVYTLDWHPHDHISFVTNAHKFKQHKDCEVNHYLNYICTFYYKSFGLKCFIIW